MRTPQARPTPRSRAPRPDPSRPAPRGARGALAVASSVCVAAGGPRGGRRRPRVAGRAEGKDGVETLPSQDFSDPFAKALKGGPPLLIEDGTVKFDFAPVTGGEGGVGQRVKFGLLKEKVRPEEVDNSPAAVAARAALREQAARDLVNIDGEERERRRTIGIAAGVLVLVLGALLLFFHAPWYSRAGVFPLVALAYGFVLSAEEGLWNIGQAGLWDVDGTGMQKIEDQDLALKLRAKVMAFNQRGVVAPAAVTAAFVVLPSLAELLLQ